jgi:hypothetical protein
MKTRVIQDDPDRARPNVAGSPPRAEVPSTPTEPTEASADGDPQSTSDGAESS